MNDTPPAAAPPPDEGMALSSPSEPSLAADSSGHPAVAADLAVPWDGVDLLVFAFFWLGTLAITLSVSADLVLLWTRQPAAALESNARLYAARLTLQQVIWLPLLMLYLGAVLRIRFGRPFWSGIGWRKYRAGKLTTGGTALLFFFAGLVVQILFQIASVLVDTGQKLPIERVFEDRLGALALSLLAVAGAPLVEETIFRGYVYPVLARRWGTGGGVAATGVVFGLLHAQQLWGGWGHIALLVLVGIIMTRIRASSGSVTPSFFFHLGYNALIAIAQISAMA